MTDTTLAPSSALVPRPTVRMIRARIAEVPTAGMLLAMLLGAIPLVQVGAFEHSAWAPKAVLGLATLPVGLVAIARLIARRDRAALAGVLAVAAATVSTLRSSRPLLSLVGPPNVGNGLLLMVALVGTWAAVRVSSDRTRAAVRVALVASGVVSSVLAWGGVALGLFPVDAAGRAAAYTGNPVFLGALTAATAVYFVCAAGEAAIGRVGEPNMSAWLLLGAGLAAGAVQLTSTRSSALVVLAGCGYAVARFRRVALAPVMACVVGTAVAMLCAGLAGTSTIAGRLGAEGVADNVRPVVWRAAIAAVRAAPWWGNGAGRANVAVSRHLVPSACVLFRTSDVHDLGLQLLVAVGAIGSAAVVGWVVLAARRASGPSAVAAVALVGGSLLQPFSLVTAFGVVALLAVAAPAVALGVPSRLSRMSIVVLAVPVLIAAALLLVGERAWKQADVGAEARPYALAARVLPPWPELAALGVKANVLDSRAAAEQSAREAIRRDPDDDIGWTRLAALQARDGRTDQARQNFLQALERNPASYEALQSLAALDGRPPACPVR